MHNGDYTTWVEQFGGCGRVLLESNYEMKEKNSRIKKRISICRTNKLYG